MFTNSINAFLFIDVLTFSPLILLTTSVITSCLGKDGYMSDMSKLIVNISGFINELFRVFNITFTTSY